MLKELLAAWRSRDPLARMFEDFDHMLDETHWMFQRAVEVFFSRADWHPLQDPLYERDKKVNKAERRIRAQIVKHLTLQPGDNLAACLVLMSVVKDAERIGDYCKNIFEVGKFYTREFTADRYLEPLERIQLQVEDLFVRTKEAFNESDVEKARQELTAFGTFSKDCDRLIQNLLQQRDHVPTDEGVAYSLLARHMKRIGAHLANIATAVVSPVHRLDYVDEPGLTGKGARPTQTAGTKGAESAARSAMAIQGVIFDLDGVIVSTDEYHYRAWKRLADELGIPFDRSVNRRLRGIGRMESLAVILESADRPYSEQEKQQLADRKNGYYRESLSGLGPDDLLPGAMAVMKELRKRGVKIAVASSSRNAPLILQRLGLEDFFDAAVDGNDISRSKPNPEVFQVAANRLGLAPGECLVVEDADAGIEAAKRGEIKALAVGPAAGHPEADLSAKSLDAVTVEQLLAL